MKSKIKNILLILFIFLPLIVTVVSLNYLPDLIPAHYGFNGEVTRYGSKYESLIGPIIEISVCMSCYVFTKYAKKTDKYKDNEKVLTITTLILALIFNAITYSFLITDFNMITNINYDLSSKIIFIALGISFIILGNYLPKCKSNNIIGIRTSLTLSNKEIWYKTHRFAGKVFVIYGLIFAIASMFLSLMINMALLLVSILAVSIIVTVYPSKIAK